MISDKNNDSGRKNTAGEGQDVIDETVESSNAAQDAEERSQDELVNDLLDMAKEREELLSALEVLEKERDESREEAARHRAEMYNFRQRKEREMKKQKSLAAESAILEFLPVLDNLERAVNVEEDHDLSHVLKGVSMVQRQFVDVLKKLGVDVIPAEGAAFSPRVHEAVFVTDVNEPEKDGMVLRELQKGFMLSDKVIRPAKVEVGRYAEDQGPQDPE